MTETLLVQFTAVISGACPGFLKGGGPISLGSLKKRHQILKGGVQWSDGGGPRTTNLAYIDAKEWTNMYFEPLISVKCCPKLHIKQLRNTLHYICLWDRVGWRGSQMKRGVPRKGGVRTPWPPPLWTRLCIWMFKQYLPSLIQFFRRVGIIQWSIQVWNIKNCWSLSLIKS